MRPRAFHVEPEPELSPAEKLRLALDLSHAMALMVRHRLRSENPHLSDDELRERFDAWQQHHPGAEHGDGVGRVVPWPRVR
jgi:hypothetical protein